MIKYIILLLLSFATVYTAQSQCEFTLTVDSAATSCLYAEEQVVWTNVIGMSVNGNNLTKTAGNGTTNSNANSVNKVFNQGYAYVVINETNLEKSFGLSSVESGNNRNTIDYSIRIRANRNVRVYENGAQRGPNSWFNAATGDTLGIRVINNRVEYLRNGAPFYQSTVMPSLPLIMDVSMNNSGGTLQEAHVGNLTNGGFNTSITSAGTGPQYSYFLNNVLQAGPAASPTYTNVAVAAGDSLHATVILAADACNPSTTITSNTIKFINADNIALSLYATSNKVDQGCYISKEPVQWDYASFRNGVFVDGNGYLDKTTGNGDDGNAFSLNSLKKGGYLEFTTVESDRDKTMGLSAADDGNNRNSIDFGIRIESDRDVHIHENGVRSPRLEANAGNTDTYRIEWTVNDEMIYYRNNEVIFVNSGPVVADSLFVDASITSAGGEFRDVFLYSPTNAVFELKSVDLGAGVLYQWQESTIDIPGATSRTNGLVIEGGDQIRMQVSPDLVGCGVVNSNDIDIIKNDISNIAPFAITAGIEESGCKIITESITSWKNTTNTVFFTNDGILKRLSGNADNGNAFSLQAIGRGGYLEFTTVESNRDKTIGLSATDDGNSRNTIDFGIRIEDDRDVHVYENGVRSARLENNAGNTDTYRIEWTSGDVIKYYRNGSVIFVSTNTPTADSMFVDASLTVFEAEFTDIKIVKYTSGEILGISSSVGASPTYDWFINGASQSSNTSSFSFNNPADGDVLYSTLVPDLEGCSNYADSSNVLTFENVEFGTAADFYIATTKNEVACKATVEEVVWVDSSFANSVFVDLDGDLRRLSGDADNGNAFSYNSVKPGGYLEFQTVESNEDKTIGLSAADDGNSRNSIDFGIRIENDRDVHVYENGVSSARLEANAVDLDIYRIEWTSGNQIRYLRNGEVLLVSTVTPVADSMFVDVSINDAGGEFRNVRVFNPSIGVFTTVAEGAGASPTYQWLLNGADIPGETNAVLTNNNLSNGDVLNVILTPDISGCGDASDTSASVTIENLDFGSVTDVFISNTKALEACKQAIEQVEWAQSSFSDDVYIDPQGDLNRLSGEADNGNAFSLNSIKRNGYLEFTTGESDRDKTIGLSATDDGSSRNTIDYGIRIENDRDVHVYENGVRSARLEANAGNNDVYRIEWSKDDVITYYREGVVIYISSNPVTADSLFVDASISRAGGEFRNVQLSSANTGVYVLSASNVGASPTYQWLLNGTIVPGVNGDVYQTDSIADGDVLNAIVTPDFGGCADNPDTTLSITIQNLEFGNTSDLFIANTKTDQACKLATEEVEWSTSSFTNTVFVDAQGDLTRLDGQADNGNAFSLNSIKRNGFLEFTTLESNVDKTIGLSATDDGSSRNTIDYGIRIDNNRDVYVFENGVVSPRLEANAGNTDTYRIEWSKDDVITYYRNGDPIFVSTNPVTADSLFVDASVSREFGEFRNVRLSSPNTGVYVLSTSNVGATPTYQWLLNGSIIPGVTSAVYQSDTISDGDVLNAIVTPDFGGCADNPDTTLSITISDLEFGTTTDFYAENSKVEVSCQEAVESVTWTNLSNTVYVDAQGDLNRLVGTADNGNAFSLNSIKRNGYLEFTIVERDRDKTIGLSAADDGASRNTIDFGLRFEDDRDVFVFENGQVGGTRVAQANNLETYRIEWTSEDQIKYYRNGAVIYINSSPTLPDSLFVDASVSRDGAEFRDVKVVNGNTGIFKAFASGAGDNPTYQWLLNGVVVPGETNSTYTNALISDNDTVAVRLTPDLGGCGDVSFVSEPIVINEVDINDRSQFSVSNIPVFNVCVFAEEEVVFTNLSNGVERSADGIIRSTGGSAWNGNAFTLNAVRNNSYIYAIVGETGRDKAFGLSANDDGNDQNSIDFAWFVRNDRRTFIVENGSTIGGSRFNVNATDTLKVINDEGTIKYYRNSTLIYTSLTAPAAPILYGDFSLQDNGAEFRNVRIVGGSIGKFLFSGQNLGDNPTYQWRLNGENVGPNDTTYINGRVVQGDIIRVITTPDLGGCATASAQISNSVRIINDELFNSTINATTWLGVNTDWEDENNWNNGIPDAAADVTIPNLANDPIISNDAAVHSISFQAGSELTINNSSFLAVQGDWIDNGGTFNPGTGTVSFSSCEDTTKVDADRMSFYTIEMSNTRGIEFLTDNDTIEIGSELIFNDGLISTNGGAVVFADDATYSNVSDSSHIVGAVKKVGNDAFTFPVGSDSTYRPISISAPSLITDAFTAVYVDSGAGPAFNRASLGDSLERVSGGEYWDLERSSGSSDVNVTLSWNLASEVGNLADLRIGHWNADSAHWENLPAVAVGNDTSGTITTKFAQDDFSPFALASTTDANPLPVEYLNFEAVIEENVGLLYWTTSLEVNNDYFVLQRSNDGLNWVDIGEVDGNGTTQQAQTYEFIDNTPYPGVNYYRLIQFDFDGVNESSDIVSVLNEIEKDEISVYPIPTNNRLYIESSGSLNNAIIQLLDAQFTQENVEIIEEGGRLALNIESLQNGVYFLTVTNGSAKEVFRIVKN